MVASYQGRIERLDRIFNNLPVRGDGLDARRLLERLGGAYPGASDGARLRGVQRDLEELSNQGRVEITNAGHKPLRYLRCAELHDDTYAQRFALEQLRTAIKELIPAGDISSAMRLIADHHDVLGTQAGRVRILADGLQLIPAAIAPGVLNAALEALVNSNVLIARYRDTAGKVTTPTLHPQAIVQRGPRVYLYALKNDEYDVRIYALQRFTRASVGEARARKAPHFALDHAIDSGFADFSEGAEITLTLRARGYVAELLHDCALSTDHLIHDEPDDSPFDIRVVATLRQSGKLLRWLLGCGDNIEVVEPLELRSVIAAQHGRASTLYQTGG